MISGYFLMLKSLLWLLFAAAIIDPGFCNGERSNLTGSCIQIERQALLEFKSNLTDPLNRLASWNHTSADCCTWYGIVCHKVTGHVLELHLKSISYDEYWAFTPTPNYKSYLNLLFGGKVSPSLLKLKHLRYLDLSNNDFGGIQIPKFFGSLESLRYLNLSSSRFIGNIPHQLENLSNLQYLDLRDTFSIEDNLDWLSGLSSLKFLDLSYMILENASNWLQNVNTLPFLKELHLYDCSLPDVKMAPLIKINFSSLSVLDLSTNGLIDSSKLSSIFQLQSLISLNLRDNHFQGLIPNSLQNLTSIKELDLSWNAFQSPIPKWLYDFRYLEILKLDGNYLLQGDISSGFGNITSLMTLDLSHTGFKGGFPLSFKNLCNLKILDLSKVNISKQVGEILQNLYGCASNGLEALYLMDCQLSSHLTHHLGQFKALKKLDISHNLLAGDVSEIHLINLTELRELYVSENQLRFKVNYEWSPPFQKMKKLFLDSCLVGPQFPSWLSPLKYLSHLDLSNSGISSRIPPWFWKFSTQLQYVDLSHNKIEGVLPNKLDTPQLVSLDLSANLLEGPLPSISSSIQSLDLSNNSLFGSLSNILCSNMNKTNFLKNLILRRNLLQGEIPDCWTNWGNLELLQLSSNKFHGHIPRSIGTLNGLESLHLRNNNLSGKIPFSLRNCQHLITLDLSKNQLLGVIPKWIGKTFPTMVYLNLRENNFHGQIPGELCHRVSLQILDLASNNLSGPIPKCIKNFNAMVMGSASFYGHPYYHDDNNNTFMEEADVVMKEKLVEYNTIFDLVRSLDLSSNKLSGEIPKGITSLTGLQSLNLSHNLLSGRIPEDIGTMKSLESMDFSQNQLFGEIPPSLANLNFLSHLNLSNNNLSGRIPLGTQIQGFNSSCFYGNKDLCGKPLSNNCIEEGIPSKAPKVTIEDGKGLQVDWFYVSMALGFVVGLWGVLGPLVFNRQWRYKYFLLLNHLGDKIYWSFH